VSPEEQELISVEQDLAIVEEQIRDASEEQQKILDKMHRELFNRAIELLMLRDPDNERV